MANINFQATSWKESEIDPDYKDCANLSGWTILDTFDSDEEQAGICLLFNPKEGSDKTYLVTISNKELVKAFGL